MGRDYTGAGRGSREEGLTLPDFRACMVPYTIQVLYRGTGLSEVPTQYDDLDDLAGSWVHDPEFDAALSEQDTVDPELWK